MLRIQGKTLNQVLNSSLAISQLRGASRFLVSPPSPIPQRLLSCGTKAVVHHSQLCLKNRTALQKRFLASNFDENYILQQNNLSEEEKKKMQEEVKKDFEDWVPYGLCPEDKEEDIFRYKVMMVSVLTLGVVFFVYMFAHMPTPKKRDWVSREAYLELERRQRLGLPLVDKNLIPEEQIVLPTQEELGDDYDIII